MYSHVFDDEDGNLVHEFDQEALEYFIQGYELLLHADPNSEVRTEAFEMNEEGMPESAHFFILRKILPGQRRMLDE